MSFAPKTNDWRRLPTEAREALLMQLQQRGGAGSGERLSPVDLAIACGFKPDPWQRDLLEAKDQQVILNCSRQSGKSTVAALIATHGCIYSPDSLVLVLAPSQRQS